MLSKKSLLKVLFGGRDGMKDPEYFKDRDECEYDCLGCPHLDVDCEGDELGDEELFHELYDDDDEW